MYKKVIRTNTGLTTIQELCTRQLFNCMIKVSCFMNNSGALSAKFQNARCKILRCRLSNDSSDLGRSSKANQIKFLFVEFDCNINTSFDASNEILVQITLNKLFKNLTSCRCDFRWLKNNCVSGGDTLDDWF